MKTTDLKHKKSCHHPGGKMNRASLSQRHGDKHFTYITLEYFHSTHKEDGTIYLHFAGEEIGDSILLKFSYKFSIDIVLC